MEHSISSNQPITDSSVFLNIYDAFSIYNVPRRATWRALKNVILTLKPSSKCMVRIIVPGIASVEGDSPDSIGEIMRLMHEYEWDGHILVVQPPLTMQQQAAIVQTAMDQYHMYRYQMYHHAYPWYVPYVSFYPQEHEFELGSPASVTSHSSGSSLTSSPMPYYVQSEWQPPLFPFQHRFRHFGAYKPRQNMNLSDVPLDKNRLFVGNIPFATTWYELKTYLKESGPVSHVEIQTNDIGDSLGFAIVTFGDEEAAKRAIEMFDGKTFGGRQLKVHYDRMAKRNSYLSMAPPFIGGLSTNTTITGVGVPPPPPSPPHPSPPAPSLLGVTPLGGYFPMGIIAENSLHNGMGPGPSGISMGDGMLGNAGISVGPGGPVLATSFGSSTAVSSGYARYKGFKPFHPGQ